MLADRPLIIAYNGKGVTHIFSDGKVYGDGITGILFEQKEPEHSQKHDVTIRITADDVNIVGRDERCDIEAFKRMIDRITGGKDKE